MNQDITQALERILSADSELHQGAASCGASASATGPR
jgi:hypothetical protein